MKEPAVSVIIPVYNRPQLMAEALESVLGQDFCDFEVIVVDDGSDDGTGGVLESFRERAGRERPDISLIIVKQEHTGMPGQARNRGASEARGRYLAFLDSDDLWEPEKLSIQTEYFRTHGNIRIVHTREKWLRGEKVVSQKSQKHRREGDIFTDALEKCIIGPSTVMMEKSLYEEVGGFHETTEIAEDYELWLRITSRYPVGYIDKPLIVKRAGSWDQLSEKYGQIEIFRIKALEMVVAEGLIPEDKIPGASKVLARKCRIYAAGCVKRGKIEESEVYLKKTLKYEKPEEEDAEGDYETGKTV